MLFFACIAAFKPGIKIADLPMNQLTVTMTAPDSAPANSCDHAAGDARIVNASSDDGCSAGILTVVLAVV